MTIKRNKKIKKKNKKICSICLESVIRPANLQLNCQCKYYTHYKCFKQWWNIKHQCIICHTNCNKPLTYSSKNKTPKLKKRYQELDEEMNNLFSIIDRQINIVDNREDASRMIYEHIYENAGLHPFDNENELKGCFVGIIIVLFVYFFLT